MIEKYTSKNGLRIVLEEIPTVRSVTIGIWILAGSRNETLNNNGISHFLEHMLFKGTKTRTAQDIAEAFDSIGGQINAFTSKEYTCLYARVLDNHKEYAIEVLSDMFFESLFDETEIEREKKVVLEEIKMYEDTPDDIIHDVLAKASYGEHPLGYPILGTNDLVNSFSKETLKNYQKEQYTPQNVVVSVAGNVDQSFIQTIETYFDRFTSNEKRQKVEEPTILSRHIERNKDTEQAHLCIGYKGLALDDTDIFNLIIMNNVFGGSMSSRLFQEIREKEGLAYAVFSYHSSFLDNGLLTIYAGTGVDQLPHLQNKIEETIDTFVTKGITEKEVKNSKEQLKGSMVLGLESTSSRMSRNGKNELLLNRHRSLDEMIQAIEEVNQDSVNRMIKSTFEESPSTALIVPKGVVNK